MSEASKKRWINFRFPKNLRFKEDVTKALETIVALYHQLARPGMIVPL